MLYPIYVHKEDGTAFGAAFPDFPGCFAASDTLQGLPGAAQEAVEAHSGIDNDPIPAPTSPDIWTTSADYQNGFWMLVDIDLGKVRNRSVRLNISLPESLVPRVDAYAKQRGMSRSAFLAIAAEHEMAAS